MNQETKTKVAEADQGAIGIKGMSVSTEYSQQLNMPEGVYVSEVTKGGGAEKAGMTRGCIITGINGTTVSSMDDLQEQLQYYAKGDEAYDPGTTEQWRVPGAECDGYFRSKADK